VGSDTERGNEITVKLNCPPLKLVAFKSISIMLFNAMKVPTILNKNDKAYLRWTLKPEDIASRWLAT
jgi:hypothetical protein